MPTAAKFLAGLMLAVLGWYASELVKGLLPEREAFGNFTLWNTAICFLVGWITIGTRAGRGASAAISNGVTGVVAALFWCLAVQSANMMVDRAFDRRYDSMLEAVAAVFELIVENAALLVDANFILTLVAGAVIVGYLTEVVSRHWR